MKLRISILQGFVMLLTSKILQSTIEEKSTFQFTWVRFTPLPHHPSAQRYSSLPFPYMTCDFCNLLLEEMVNVFFILDINFWSFGMRQDQLS